MCWIDGILAVSGDAGSCWIASSKREMMDVEVELSNICASGKSEFDGSLFITEFEMH